MTAIRFSSRPSDTRWSAQARTSSNAAYRQLHVVGVHELPPEPRRAADVRREDGDPGRRQRLVLRVEHRPLLRLRAAVQAQHRRRPSAAGAPVQPAGQRQPVPAGEPLQGRHDERAVGHLRALGDPRPARGCAVSRCHSSRGRSGPSTPRITDDPSRESTGVVATSPGSPEIGVDRPRRGVEQLELAGAGHVPDQQQQPAGVVGVHPLEVGVVAGGQAAGLAAPPVRPERQAEQHPAGQADVRGEVDVHRAGVLLGGRPDQRPSVEPVAPWGSALKSSSISRSTTDTNCCPRSPSREHEEPLLERDVEHVDEVALGERVEPAGQRVGEVGAGGLAGAGAGEGDHEAVAAARPRAELGVRLGVAGDAAGVGAVGPHHPHLRADAAVRGDRAAEPAAVGRPAHRDHRVVGEPHVPGRRRRPSRTTSWIQSWGMPERSLMNAMRRASGVMFGPQLPQASTRSAASATASSTVAASRSCVALTGHQPATGSSGSGSPRPGHDPGVLGAAAARAVHDQAALRGRPGSGPAAPAGMPPARGRSGRRRRAGRRAAARSRPPSSARQGRQRRRPPGPPSRPGRAAISARRRATSAAVAAGPMSTPAPPYPSTGLVTSSPTRSSTASRSAASPGR